MIRVLGMEESESMIYDISKHVKKSQIKMLNLKPKKRQFLIDSKNIEFFDSENIEEQIKYLERIKDQFDICIVSSWTTARLAYLANINYIIFFVGHDIRTPPFQKNNKVKYFDETLFQFGFFERKFYKDILNNALICVAGSQELFSYLQKYRQDAFRIDRVFVDTVHFNPEIQPVDLPKTKFTFFSPQRIGLEKGTHILWKSILNCKTDFNVIQINWMDDRTIEAKKTSEEILKNIPPAITLIDKIPRSEMGKYYAFADAVLGEMMTGHTNSIEREASLCKKPVLNYNDLSMKSFLDRKEINTPFLPHSQKIEDISSLIDKIVESKEFREKITTAEHEFMLNLTDANNAAKEWDDLFQHAYLIRNSRIKLSFWKKMKRKFLFNILKLGNSFEKQLP